MTTPAQDAPLVFPSVAFRPVRLLVICAAVSGLVTVAAALVGYPLFGAFFAIGMALGLTNALLVRRAVDSITAGDHPLKKKMALNSASRLLAITVVGVVAWRVTSAGARDDRVPAGAALGVLGGTLLLLLALSGGASALGGPLARWLQGVQWPGAHAPSPAKAIKAGTTIPLASFMQNPAQQAEF